MSNSPDAPFEIDEAALDDALAAPHDAAPDAAPRASAFASRVRRLREAADSPKGRRILNIAVPVAVIGVAALTRLPGLDYPHALVFDETYYVKDGYSIYQLGYEGRWGDDPNPAFEAGDASALEADPSFVVHPPLGKWMLGWGMALFGIDNAAAWRLPVALAGIALVALTYCIGRSLTRSRTFAGLAAFALALDGQAIVLSRTALLDTVLALFILGAAGAMLLDRRGAARRLRPSIAARGTLRFGPVLLARPWLVTAGVLLGAACAVKWSGLYFLAAFGLWSVAMELFDRRRARLPRWPLTTLLGQAPASFVLVVLPALGTYLASYTGWFVSRGYGYGWADANPEERLGGFLAWVPNSVQSLWRYHVDMWNFHVGLTKDHAFQSPAIEWFAMLRPTAFYFVEGDGANAFITALANPAAWYPAVIALAVSLYLFGRSLDWRIGFLLVAIAAGYVPWLLVPERTIFSFYTIVFSPLLYLLLALIAQRAAFSGPGVLDKRRMRIRTGEDRRIIACTCIGALVAMIIACYFFFMPIWYGMWLDPQLMQWRFWVPRWR